MPKLKLNRSKISDDYGLSNCDYYENSDPDPGDMCSAKLYTYSYGKLYVNKKAVLALNRMDMKEFYRVYDSVCSPCIGRIGPLREKYFEVFMEFVKGITLEFKGRILDAIKIELPDRDFSVIGECEKYIDKLIPYTEPEDLIKVYLRLLSLYVHSGYLMRDDTECFYQIDADTCIDMVGLYYRGSYSEIYTSYYGDMSLEDAQKMNMFANIPYSKTITNTVENRF